MTPDALLAELQRCGVILVAEGDSLRYRPRSAVPPELIPDLQRHKAALIRLLPDYAALYSMLTATLGTAEDVAAIQWYVTLNGDGFLNELADLERRCERLAQAGADEVAYRAAVIVLVARLRQIRAWHRTAQRDGAVLELPPSRSRLTLDVNRPVRGPIHLDDGTEIIDVGKFVAQIFGAIDYVLQRPPRSYPEGAALIRLYIQQLEQVGVRAHVEVVQ